MSQVSHVPGRARPVRLHLFLRPSTGARSEKLTEVEGWDSLSTMAFIAMADKELGLALPGNHVLACRTVEDLLGLLGVAAASRAA